MPTSTETKREIVKPLYLAWLIIAFVAILYYGSSFLIPLAYGVMFAFLVTPIHKRLVAWGLHKYLSALLSTLTIVLFFVALLSALGWQIQELSDQSDQIQKQLINTQEKAQTFAKEWFGISPNKQEQYADKFVDKIKSNAGRFVGNTASIFSNFFLSLIYSILLLGERKRIRNFFVKLFKDDEEADRAVEETSSVAQDYLVGKLIVIGILAVAYSIGFLIAGIKYAILLGVLSAFLSFIPYAGNLIGAALAVLITLATGGGMREVIIILAVMSVAQVIESYILTPWIIGDNIDLNPFFSIISVVGFSILWGAAGAIIALPLTGILKVLFSHIETYKTLAYVMGNQKEENT